jgi:opine dehydrogenase
MKKIAVLGGGNGAHAMAADLALKGFEVSLYSRSTDKLKPVRDQGGITLVESSAERVVPIRRVCQSFKEVLEDAEAVLITVAAMAHEDYARGCAPYLKSGQTVFLLPGSTGGSLAFRRLLRTAGNKADVPICETNVLTYICRLIGPARVRITARLKLEFGGLPGTRMAESLKMFEKLFPENRTTGHPNVLESSLTNFNAVLHPPGMIMNAGWIEYTKGDFSYYCEGGTAAVAKVIEAVDRERVALCDRIGYQTDRFLDFFYKAGATSERAFKAGSVHVALQESEANRFIRAPENLSYRFLTEDVPYGLVPMAYLGRMLNIPTPTMDALIGITSVVHETDYWKTGWTPEKMGIEGMNLDILMDYVEKG